MKNIISALSLFVSQFLWAQVPVHNSNFRPLLIIDSSVAGVPSSLDILSFNPNDIESVTVDKNYIDSSKKINGKIYVTMKNPRDFNFLSISHILKQYGIKAGKQHVYLINNAFLTDTTYFRVDSSQILSVKEETYLFEYMQNLNRELRVVHIKTKTKENLEERQREIDKSKKIWIRGITTSR